MIEEAVPSLPTDTSLLIRVHAVSLNYRDANMLNGTNPFEIKSDGIPCSDAAGSVVLIGKRVTRFKIGDRVSPIVDQKAITGREQDREWLGGEVNGVLSDFVIFDEETCVKLPEHLSWAEAACLACAGVTAWSALARDGSLVPGMSVLLQGTGGVSMMALKFARAAGCKVILTSSSDEKLEHAKALYTEPAIATINYSTKPEWELEVLKLNGGVGVDIVLENGGTSSLLQSVKAAKKGGIVSQVGYLGKQSGAHIEGLVPLLIDKTVNLRGINVGTLHDFESLNGLVEATELRFEDVIDKRFGFEQAAEAIEYLWSGQHMGKVIIEL
ncbi:putative alcohol dehydrogenase [Lophiotrema nucula]|uniref:Putative alcohol dehydrogenase n=1 Tax=Lophiotrema nucula TaxID=690887 RepID=A0A6A5YGF0_9PLEO|nr:putative alcohol dehydrogenase [Lophiotrema nucula]